MDKENGYENIVIYLHLLRVFYIKVYIYFFFSKKKFHF